ncbi:MAG: transporter substrate-binding domain-containing protein [Spirochaetales bacterium]|nr:transporter substrate-binding domain-containing protein [Spirochaetales bacterium]
MEHNSKYIITLRVLLMALLMFSSLLSLWADNNEEDSQEPFPYLSLSLTPEEVRWIEEHPKIVISGPQNFPPFHFYNEEGDGQGIASDYVKNILNRIDVEAVNRVDIPWAEVLRQAKTHEIDLVACAARNPEREEYLLFTEPILSFPLVIISRDDSPFISGLEDLHDVHVAVIEKNIINDWLRQDGINIVPHYFDSPKESLEALSNGLVDAYIENLGAASYLINKYGLTNLKVAAPTKYGNYDLYIAVRDDWPELVSIINKGLAALSPLEHSEIRNEWLSIKYEYGIQLMDVIKVVLIVSGIFLAVFAVILIWNRKLEKEIRNRKKVEAEREAVILELKQALDSIKTLEGLLPICASCKKIRDDKGYWSQLENYFEEHSEVLFSHSLCPECFKDLYGKQKWYKEIKDRGLRNKSIDDKKSAKNTGNDTE